MTKPSGKRGLESRCEVGSGPRGEAGPPSNQAK